MAFKALPISAASRGKEPSNIPSIAIHHANQASLSIPRTLLREAGLPDLPGAKFDVLIGTGEDEGTIALIQGSRIAASAQGDPVKPTRLILRVSGLARKDEKMKSVPVAFEVDRRQIILTLPAAFPLADMTEVGSVAAAPAAQPMELGAAA